MFCVIGVLTVVLMAAFAIGFTVQFFYKLHIWRETTDNKIAWESNRSARFRDRYYADRLGKRSSS